MARMLGHLSLARYGAELHFRALGGKYFANLSVFLLFLIAGSSICGAVEALVIGVVGHGEI